MQVVAECLQVVAQLDADVVGHAGLRVIEHRAREKIRQRQGHTRGARAAKRHRAVLHLDGANAFLDGLLATPVTVLGRLEDIHRTFRNACAQMKAIRKQ